MTEPVIQPPSALELIADCIARLRITDPTDTGAGLLAAWHGFGTAQAAGMLLAADSGEDAVLARNAQPVFAAVATLVRRAPSLPYTDFVVENVGGLVPDDYTPRDYSDQLDDPNEVADISPAGSVRRGILALALELNTLLPMVAQNATDSGDRTACEHGTRLAYELSNCWEGRLCSYLNNSRDLIGDRRSAAPPRTNSKRKRKPKRK